MSTRTTPGALLLALASLVGAGGAAGQQAQANPHGALPEALGCAACHTSQAWSPLREPLGFDHGSTRFALEGRHEDAACATCHGDLVFRVDGVKRADDCASCHLDVHLGTPTRPCVSCHTTESFQELPAGLVHPADFPLEGAHLQTACESCHTDDLGGAFSPPDRECATCHMRDYVTAPLVDHQRLGFSTDCTECHSTLDFRDVPFDHFTISGGFDLRGQHAGIECASCHSSPDGGVPWAPAGPDDCVSCHLLDYDREHGGSGYPTDCASCHTASTWDGAVFDHATATGFELLPDHDRLACMACHVGSTSETLFSPSGPRDCYACHALDYDREHAGSGFSTDCLDCHRGTTWSGATFDHAFPISAGPHSSASCADCHTVPGSFSSFTCLTCHRQSSTDSDHSAVAGYVYASPSCLSCHPDGRS